MSQPFQNPFYITTPIYYLNDVPHIGHAYTTIAADVLARYWRLAGREVHFLTGTDEHGAKIVQAASTQNRTPQEHVDKMVKPFQRLIEVIGASPDDFIRTTQDRHKRGAEEVWRRLHERGYIYKSVYTGWYAVRDEAFYDQSEIVEGKAPTGAPVIWMEEPCYFFKLSHFEKPLLDFYAKNPHFIAPQTRYNEVKGFVKSGLVDLAVSRSACKWGIEIPDAPGHVIYVWLDALSNYITALGYPDTKSALYTKFWGSALHILGKDILRFHGVYWPAFLMALDLPIPDRLFAHGWWTNEGKKISKSLGNVIDPFELIETYGVDPVRYFLMREVPFGQDGNFSHVVFKERINAELTNELGNLAQRVLVFLHKNCGGRVPSVELQNAGQDPLFMWRADIMDEVHLFMNKQEMSKYIEAIRQGVALCNQYIDQNRPWDLAKQDTQDARGKLDILMMSLLETLRYIGILLQPLMPESARKLLDQLAVPEDKRLFDAIKDGWSKDTILSSPSPLFPRRG